MKKIIVLTLILFAVVFIVQHYTILTQRIIMDRLDYAEEFDKSFAKRLIRIEAAIEGNARNTLLITEYLVQLRSQRD